mgnify:CR=1 FL=1
MFSKLKKFELKTVTVIIIVFVILVSNRFFYRFGFNSILIALAVFSIFLKREEDFLKDWLPPVLGLYLYEYVRGRGYQVAILLNRPLVLQLLVDIERGFFFFFKDIPTVVLQYAMSKPLSEVFVPNWYDFVLFFFYSLFFWYWLVVAFFIRGKDRKLFKKYMWGLVGLSLFSCLLYILFPSAPPWYASEVKILPPLRRVMLSYNYFMVNYKSLVNAYGNNNFAAFPSHHAAWPFYASLFATYVFGKKYNFLFVVPIVIAFATWYGAEHYVIDSLAGFMLAYITFRLVTKKL